MEEEENSLSVNSSCVAVSNYFSKIFKISEQAKNKLIEECISGDILIDIPKKDFKTLGIDPPISLKISKCIKENKDKLTKEITENISSISNKESIKSFFEKCLNFKGELNISNEDEFLQLDEKK